MGINSSTNKKKQGGEQEKRKVENLTPNVAGSKTVIIGTPEDTNVPVPSTSGACGTSLVEDDKVKQGTPSSGQGEGSSNIVALCNSRLNLCRPTTSTASRGPIMAARKSMRECGIVIIDDDEDKEAVSRKRKLDTVSTSSKSSVRNGTAKRPRTGLIRPRTANTRAGNRTHAFTQTKWLEANNETSSSSTSESQEPPRKVPKRR